MFTIQSNIINRKTQLAGLRAASVTYSELQNLSPVISQLN